ncbi:hypothetical protein [Peijinzhouia sedimentorum]
MKHVNKTIAIFLLSTLFQCERIEPVSELSQLCSYKNQSALQTSLEVCMEENFIMEVDGISGEVQYNSELNSFIVVSNASNSFDCRIIGVLCNDYENLVGKSVEYSGKFFEYTGSYKSPIGGQKVFVIKEFEYVLN